MTVYKITVLIAPEPFEIEGNSSFLDPYYIRADGTALFKDAKERILSIEDDDDFFSHPIYFGRPEQEEYADQTGQTLVEDFDFSWSGNDSLISAGTRLGRIAGTQIRDEDNNHFWVLFPYPYEAFPSSYYREKDELTGEYVFARDEVIGGRQAVMIFPLNKMDQNGNEIKDENGNSILSTFDKNAVFQGLNRQVIPEREETLEYTKCFAQGSLIQTLRGLQTVETLKKGDMVLTRDHGPQPIIWIGHTNLNRQQINHAPHKRPILIRKNALGAGLPDRDLMVSPQHRIFVQSNIARRMFGEDEVLVAAKHLLELPRIDTICPRDGINYWHILLPQHELVLSHGTWTESFYLGAYALRTLAPDARAELRGIIPGIEKPDFTPHPARRMLTGREGRKLVQRHVKNCKPLIMAAGQLRLQAQEKGTMSMA